MRINTCLPKQKTSRKTITKSTLSAHYNIDRATLIKWLVLFCNDIFLDKNDLLNRRKFTNLEVAKIKKKLGNEGQSFSKADLVRLAETDYKTIRDNIKKYQSLYGITIMTYRRLSKFPPKIAKRIIDSLG